MMPRRKILPRHELCFVCSAHVPLAEMKCLNYRGVPAFPSLDIMLCGDCFESLKSPEVAQLLQRKATNALKQSTGNDEPTPLLPDGCELRY